VNNPSANTREAMQHSSGPAAGGEGMVAFAGFLFDSYRQELIGKQGIPIALAPKSLALLSYLLGHAGRVLPKDELIQALWGAVVVTDDSLVQCVKDLRTALGDKEQQLIKTLPRRGYMFDVAVTEHARSPPPVPQLARALTMPLRWWIWALAGVALLGALLGAGAAWKRQNATPIDIDEEIRNRRSVAILAFSDRQAKALGSALGDDMADAIASQFVRSGMRVIGRAVNVRHDPEAPQFERIGQEQGVRYVVGVRVTRGDGKTAVDTYLTEIASGAVFRLHEAEFKADEDAVRSSYARDVLTALHARYYEIETIRARLPGREKNPVDRIALAWRDLDRGNTKADLESARRHFTAAVEADPHSVEAMLGLGVSHLNEFYSFYSESPSRTLDQAERTLKQALELSPENGQVLSAWAEVLFLRERPEEAFWIWRRALEIAPDSPNSHLRLAGALIKQGRYEEAQVHLGSVTDLRPFQMRRQQNLNQALADAAFAQGRDDEAYRILTHWAVEFPGSGRPYLMLAAIDALYWRDASAAAHMAKHRQMLPQSTIAYVNRIYPSDNPIFLAQRARLVDGLRKAGLPEGGK
jgi:adenylate cyclase